jgi:hypothetical protein
LALVIGWFWPILLISLKLTHPYFLDQRILISQSVSFSAVTGTLSHAFRNTFIDRFFHNGWAEALIGFQPPLCDRCGQSFVQNRLSQDLFAPLKAATKN